MGNSKVGASALLITRPWLLFRRFELSRHPQFSDDRVADAYLQRCIKPTAHHIVMRPYHSAGDGCEQINVNSDGAMNSEFAVCLETAATDGQVCQNNGKFRSFVATKIRFNANIDTCCKASVLLGFSLLRRCRHLSEPFHQMLF